MLASFFDRLELLWESAALRRVLAASLVAAFAVALLAIELGRRGLLPGGMAPLVPASHFRAIELAFYLLLAYEAVGLVFGLARSVANAAGKQLEIFSLILLRHSFEVLAGIDEPIRWAQLGPRVPEMLSNAAGALGIFVVLGLYYRLQRHQPAPGELRDRASFIAAKKVIALLLLLVFAVVGLRSVAALVTGREGHGFFEQFFTLLIFADILVVLLALRYSSTYRVVFRNSGLAVATMLLRLALSAPPFVNAGLGLAGALLALALTAAYNTFGPGEAGGAPARADEAVPRAVTAAPVGPGG